MALRKLDMLDAAVELRDLRQPPGNQLEALRNDRAGQHSIRINDRWLCASSGRTAEGAMEVELSTITEDEAAPAASRIRTLPGELLRHDFMKPHGLGASALARAVRVSPHRGAAILSERHPRAITPDMSLRLSRLFDTTPQFWRNLQLAYDLSVAIAAHGSQIELDVRPIAA